MRWDIKLRYTTLAIIIIVVIYTFIKQQTNNYGVIADNTYDIDNEIEYIPESKGDEEKKEIKDVSIKDTEQHSQVALDRHLDTEEPLINGYQMLRIINKEERYEGTLALRNHQIKKYDKNSSIIYNVTKINILIVSVKTAPVIDITYVLNKLNVDAKVLNPSENVTMKNINLPENILQIDSDSIERFYTENVNVSLISQSDAFLCVYPIVFCRLFTRFKKPIILYFEDRFEAASHSFHLWESLNRFITSLSRDNRNSLLASTVYDSEYVRYFTKVVPKNVPFICDYIAPSNAIHHLTIKRKYLLWAYRKSYYLSTFLDDVQNQIEKIKTDIKIELSWSLSGKELESCVDNYDAVIVLPNQVGSQAMTEFYRMGIPLIVPSLSLLTSWHSNYRVLQNKRCHLCDLLSPNYKLRQKSLISGVMATSDPNNDSKKSHIGYWLMFSDYFTLDHLLIYDSVPNLVEVMINFTEENLGKTRKNMADINMKTRQETYQIWQNVVSKIRNSKSPIT